MATPYDIQSPEKIASEYGGDKKRIAEAMQRGLVDPTTGTMAGMFIDRMVGAQDAQQAAQPTIAEQTFNPQATQPQPPPPQQVAQAGVPGAQMSQNMFAGGGMVGFAEGERVYLGGGEPLSVEKAKKRISIQGEKEQGFFDRLRKENKERGLSNLDRVLGSIASDGSADIEGGIPGTGAALDWKASRGSKIPVQEQPSMWGTKLSGMGDAIKGLFREPTASELQANIEANYQSAADIRNAGGEEAEVQALFEKNRELQEKLATLTGNPYGGTGLPVSEAELERRAHPANTQETASPTEAAPEPGLGNTEPALKQAAGLVATEESPDLRGKAKKDALNMALIRGGATMMVEGGKSGVAGSTANRVLGGLGAGITTGAEGFTKDMEHFDKREDRQKGRDTQLEVAKMQMDTPDRRTFQGLVDSGMSEFEAYTEMSNIKNAAAFAKQYQYGQIKREEFEAKLLELAIEAEGATGIGKPDERDARIKARVQRYKQQFGLVSGGGGGAQRVSWNDSNTGNGSTRVKFGEMK